MCKLPEPKYTFQEKTQRFCGLMKWVGFVFRSGPGLPRPHPKTQGHPALPPASRGTGAEPQYSNMAHDRALMQPEIANLQKVFDATHIAGGLT